MVADQDDSCDEGRLELQVEEGERLNQASGFTEALSGHHLYIPAQCAADLMEFVRIVKVKVGGGLFKMLLLHQAFTCHHFSDYVHWLNRPTVHIVHMVVQRVAIGKCCSENIGND